MRILGVLGLIIGLALSAPALAAPANPEMVAHDYTGPDGEERDEPLRIGEMDIQVRIAGGAARTTATITFQNPSNSDVEGDFTLDLPAGSIITAYALDVEGRMIDGVLVGSRQATLAYEEKVRQGVDPGIATVTRSGAFKARVFPIMAGSSRTIRLSFVTALRTDTPFVLPLETVAPVGKLTVSVTGEGGAVTPPITWPEGLRPTGEGAASAADVRLAGALTIAPVQRRAALSTARHGSGESFFDIDDAVDVGAGAAAPVRRVRIYWDRSLSRRDDDLTAELGLLDAWLARVKPQAVDLILFDADAPRLRSFTGANAVADLKAALSAVDYTGASALTGLFALSAPPVDACLLFSDGVMSVDAYGPERAGCPLFTVSSAGDADRGFLRALATRSGGEHLDLSARPPDALIDRLTRAAPRVVSVRTAEGREIDFRLLPAPSGRFRVVGQLPVTDALEVQLSGAGAPTRRYVVPRTAPVRHDGLGAIWAFDRVSEMSASDRPDQDRLIAFVRRYQVASPAAAFIVLESVDDYVEAGIEPPAIMGKAALAEYREARAELDGEKREEQADRLGEVIELWQAQKAWWATRYTAPPAGSKRDDDARGQAGAPPPPPPPSPVAPAPIPIEPRFPVPAAVEADEQRTGVDEMVVTASRRAPPTAAGIPGAPQAGKPTSDSDEAMEVELKPWNPDRPYLTALKVAGPQGFAAAFKVQELEHGALPGFYLDVAEWLFREGRASEARTVAATALELPAANVTTQTIVASRLQRYGDNERAIWLYEQILFLEPDRPQPRRNLALALIERAERPGATAESRKADYARALDLLTEVIMTPWDGDYDGIEVVTLMEANRIIPRLQAMGVKRIALDKRLIALLDVDLRITLEWNTNDTDMDLWVDEPSGERSIYSNPETQSGGRLSNDMTEGYGPEEYLLRRAPKGEFQIRANTFDPDRLDPNGPVTIRVKIYRAWARPEERVETIEVEMKADEDGAQLLGKVTVGGRPK